MKVKSSWAGLYECKCSVSGDRFIITFASDDSLCLFLFLNDFIQDNPIDQNAIIGQHPEMENHVVLANGFRGHGLQHSPAAGRAVAELLSCNGQFETLDLQVFSFDRFIENRPLFEAGIV